MSLRWCAAAFRACSTTCAATASTPSSRASCRTSYVASIAKLEDLQRGIQEVRMVPLSQVFDKLHRVVRQMSRESDRKEIQFVVTGGDTKLDKLMIEELSEPMMHIIRNAIDHGIEDRDTRRSRGKPDHGTIAISAEQRGNKVVIEVFDDGNGIDTKTLVQRAVAKGLISEEASRGMSRDEQINLIFPARTFDARRRGPEQRSRRRHGCRQDQDHAHGRHHQLVHRAGPGHALYHHAADHAGHHQGAGHSHGGPHLCHPAELGHREPDDRLRPDQDRRAARVYILRNKTLPLVRLDEMFSLSRPADQPEPTQGYIVVVKLAAQRLGFGRRSGGAAGHRH